MRRLGAGFGVFSKLAFSTTLFIFLCIPSWTLGGDWENDKQTRNHANYLNEELPEDWVDYKDMFNYDMSTKTMKDDASKIDDPASCPPCPTCPEAEQSLRNGGVSTTKDDNDLEKNQNDTKSEKNSDANDACKAESQLSLVCLSTFRKLMRLFVEAGSRSDAGGSEEEEQTIDFRADFKIPVDHLRVMRNIIPDSDDKDNEESARASGCRDLVWAFQHFSASIDQVKRQKEGSDVEDVYGEAGGDFFFSLEAVKGMAKWTALAATVLAGVFGLFVMRKAFNTSISGGDVGKVVLLVYVVLFIVSVPWNWMSLYQQAQSKQTAIRSQSIPAECGDVFASEGESQSGSYLDSLKGAFKSIISLNPFGWADKEDPCQKFHDAFHVDILGQVTPMKALTATINQMALEPMEYVGQAFGNFSHGVFRNLPLHMYPVAILLLVIGCLLLKGYQLSLGPFFSIGPAAQPQERLLDSSRPSLALPENPRPTLAQDVANQLIQRLNEDNLNLRQELADARGRLMLGLESDVKSASHKPLYTSPFKEQEPLAIETARSSSPSPTRGRTARSNSAPELKKFHFHAPPPSDASSPSSLKMSTPSSSRRATLVPISEDAEDAPSSPTGPGGLIATLSSDSTLANGPKPSANEVIIEEVVNGFVLVGQKPDCKSEQNATITAENDRSTLPTKSADVKMTVASNLPENALADETVRLCNLSIDE